MTTKAGSDRTEKGISGQAEGNASDSKRRADFDQAMSALQEAAPKLVSPRAAGPILTELVAAKRNTEWNAAIARLVAWGLRQSFAPREARRSCAAFRSFAACWLRASSAPRTIREIHR